MHGIDAEKALVRLADEIGRLREQNRVLRARLALALLRSKRDADARN